MKTINSIDFFAQKASPDIVEEIKVSDIETVTYVGFYDAQKPSGINYALIKITEFVNGSTTTTSIEYPDGLFKHAYNWLDRANYNYRKRNF